MKSNDRIAICISGLFKNWDLSRYNIFDLVQQFNKKGYYADFFLTTWDRTFD